VVEVTMAGVVAVTVGGVAAVGGLGMIPMTVATVLVAIRS
jgi:hypothetical protein